MHPIIDSLKPPRLIAVALLAVLGSVVALAVQDTPDASAYALWVDIRCGDGTASVGNTFRRHIVTEQPPNLLAETIKVYWRTVADTADETDYSPLHHEGQASNRYQSRQARMGRTFHTPEDPYSEPIEYCNVEVVNASSDGSGGGSCRIEIEDDDGPGAMETWIDSEPAAGKYDRGDTIHIKQRFTEDVVVDGGVVNLGLLFGQGSNGAQGRQLRQRFGDRHLDFRIHDHRRWP